MVYCDHASDDDVKKLFDKIKSERDGKLDVLVNAAFSGTAVSATCTITSTREFNSFHR